MGVDKYTRLPHEVFLLIRWVFAKGNKVLREDLEPSVKFHNFLPMKHLYKMLTLRHIEQASANDGLQKMRYTIASAHLTPKKAKKVAANSLDIVFQPAGCSMHSAISFYIFKSTENAEIFTSNFLLYNCRYYEGDPSYIETFKLRSLKVSMELGSPS